MDFQGFAGRKISLSFPRQRIRINSTKDILLMLLFLQPTDQLQRCDPGYDEVELFGAAATLRGAKRNSSREIGSGARARLIAPAGQQTCDGDIFIQFLPVKAAGAQRNGGPLFGRGAQQAREPRQGDAQSSAIRQLDPKAVLVEADAVSPHQRSHPISSG
jgi:hypothetical protein